MDGERFPYVRTLEAAKPFLGVKLQSKKKPRIPETKFICQNQGALATMNLNFPTWILVVFSLSF